MTRESSIGPGEGTGVAQSGGEWNALLAQYGQAMMQVGQLEKEVRDLRERLTELQENGRNNHLGAPSEEKDEELRQKNQVIASLRLQIASLSEELTSTKGKLKQAAEGNYRRHRRSHRPRPWWRFWRRRS